MRALAARQEAAIAWLRRVEWEEITASWPDLAYAEVANGLRTLVFAKEWSKAQAKSAMARTMRLQMHSTPVASLAPAALELALDRGITPYDACYVVLAELTNATLVTGDRRLAAATADAVLI